MVPGMAVPIAPAGSKCRPWNGLRRGAATPCAPGYGHQYRAGSRTLIVEA
jgi:hypothetical protein